MSSVQDEFSKEITDLESAKKAAGWALERAQGLSLSVQSLKEQLEQKNQNIKFLNQQIVELQNSIHRIEMEKSSALLKLQPYQEEINSLLYQISEREREKIQLQRAHLEEIIALERRFDEERKRFILEREEQLRNLARAKDEEIKKIALDRNQEIKALHEKFLKKETELSEREKEFNKQIQRWRDELQKEYAQKRTELSLEYSKRETSFQPQESKDLLEFVQEAKHSCALVQKLQSENTALNEKLLQVSESFRAELRKREGEFSKKLEEERKSWQKLLEEKSSAYQSALEQISKTSEVSPSRAEVIDSETELQFQQTVTQLQQTITELNAQLENKEKNRQELEKLLNEYEQREIALRQELEEARAKFPSTLNTGTAETAPFEIQQLQEQLSEKERAIETERNEFQATISRMQEEWAQKEQNFLKEKEDLAAQMDQFSKESELKMRMETIADLEKQSKELAEQKEFLSKYVQLLEERKKELEKEFTDFIKQPPKTRIKEEIAQLNQLLGEGQAADLSKESKPGLFAKLGSLFKKK